MSSPTLVIVPTYNERDNVGPLVTAALAALPEGDVLVVDDASPDGTGEFVDDEIVTGAGGGSATVNGSLATANAIVKSSASLAFDGQSSNFSPGDTITGGISGATARLVSQTDGGATGTLVLADIHGAFVDNDPLSNGASGDGAANGILSFADNLIIPFVESDTDWHVAFVANGPEIELRVTGDSNHTIEWTVEVDVVST